MKNQLNLTWDDLRVLLHLHRHKSFLQAGQSLGVSTSTAARRIEALESALGRALVRRTTDGTLLEPEALPLIELAERLESGLEAFHRQEKDTLSGVVRVSLSDGFLLPVTKKLCQLRRSHPGLRLEIISEIKNVDLEKRVADIAVRVGRSKGSSLVERKLGEFSCALFASQAYIDRRLRTPQIKTQELSRHDFIGWDGPSAKLHPLRWLEDNGANSFTVRSNSYFALVEAAQQGDGIVMLAGEAPAGLIRLEIEAKLPVFSIYLAYHHDARKIPRLRLVLDALLSLS